MISHSGNLPLFSYQLLNTIHTNAPQFSADKWSFVMQKCHRPLKCWRGYCSDCTHLRFSRVCWCFSSLMAEVTVRVFSGQLSQSHKTDKHYCLRCIKECELWHFSNHPVSVSGYMHTMIYGFWIKGCNVPMREDNMGVLKKVFVSLQLGPVLSILTKCHPPPKNVNVKHSGKEIIKWKNKQWKSCHFYRFDI